MTQPNYLQNMPVRVTRYKFIHLWNSNTEVRIKSTDTEILEKLLLSIKASYKNCEIKKEKDLTKQFHWASITKLESESRYRDICWWMFKILCERGWEPMLAESNEYKLKFAEIREIGSTQA